MKDKKVIFFVIIGLVILFLAYTLYTPKTTTTPIPTGLSNQLTSLGITKTEVVTGTLVDMNDKNLIIQTSNGISILKKSDLTRYFVNSDGINTPIDENDLQLNSRLSIVIGLDESTNEKIALRLIVER